MTFSNKVWVLGTVVGCWSKSIVRTIYEANDLYDAIFSNMIMKFGAVCGNAQWHYRQQLKTTNKQQLLHTFIYGIIQFVYQSVSQTIFKTSGVNVDQSV